MRIIIGAVIYIFSFSLSFSLFFFLITFIQLNLVPRAVIDKAMGYFSLSGDGPLAEWLIISGAGLSLLLAITACRELYLILNHDEKNAR